MPVTICEPGRLAERAAELEAAGQVITSVNQLNDGTVALVTQPRAAWPPAVERRGAPAPIKPSPMIGETHG